jgi:hypothetical protein
METEFGRVIVKFLWWPSIILSILGTLVLYILASRSQ